MKDFINKQEFDVVKFYRNFPAGGEDWLKRVLTAIYEKGLERGREEGWQLCSDCSMEY